MQTRKEIRNSLKSAVSVDNWDGVKYSATPEQIEALKQQKIEIAQNLAQDSLQRLSDSASMATSKAGSKLLAQEIENLTEKFIQFLKDTKAKTMCLRHYCTIYPTKKHKPKHEIKWNKHKLEDVSTVRVKELLLVTITHAINGTFKIVDKEAVTKMTVNSLITQLGVTLGNKLLTDKIEEQETFNNIKYNLPEEEILRKFYGVRTDEKYTARKKKGLEIARQLAEFVTQESELFELIELPVKRKDFYVNIPYITMNPDKHAEAQEILAANILNTKGLQVPCITEPREYKTIKRNKQQLVRHLSYKWRNQERTDKNKFAMDREDHEEMITVIDTVNIIEKTKWTVDAELVSFLDEMIQAGVEIDGVSSKVELSAKPPVRKKFETEEEFNAACEVYRSKNETEEETLNTRLISDWYAQLKKSVGNSSKCAAAEASLDMAKNYIQQKEMFFEYSLDKRGRIYPNSSTLNVQINDISKGLLKFSEGQETTERGAHWLRVGVATLWGEKEEIELTEEELSDEVNEILNNI